MMTIGYKQILVAVDGSNEAKRALKKAIDFAKQFDATLFICHLIDTRTFATVEQYDRTVVGDAEKHGKNLLTSYQQQAIEAGIRDVRTILDFGSPKIKIPKEIAERYSIDLIITGATGLNTVERLLIGSVSEAITRNAKCDVMIVRN